MASIYQRGKTWWGRAQRSGIEKRRSLGTTSRSKAEKRLAEWVEELNLSEWGQKARVTYRTAMALFLEQHCPTVRPSSAERYIVSSRAMFGHFEGKYLDEITRKAWREYVSARRAQGASPAAINRDRACLSKMFSVAIAAELCDTNPVPAFGREREPEGRIRFLTRAEYAKLVASAPPDMRALIVIAVNTGMRLNEILTLGWDQVDLDAEEIRITQTKTATPRSVPMPLAAAAQIRAQPRHTGNRVFAITKSKRPVMAISQRFARIAQAAGMPDVRFHDLRHTFASWATKGWHDWQDRPMRRDRLQLWLGHKSPAMTARYAHLETEDLHSEMKTGRTKTGTDATDLAPAGLDEMVKK